MSLVYPAGIIPVIRKMSCNGRCLECNLPECSGGGRIYSEKSRYCNRPEEQKQRQRDYAKRKREEAKKQGKCIICRKKKATHGSKCYECYIRQKRYDRRRSRGLRELWRDPSNGLCYFCGEPVAEGKRTCKKHLTTRQKHMTDVQMLDSTRKARDEFKRFSELVMGAGISRQHH